MSQGIGPVNPGDDKKVYEQEYKHGANLFKKALDNYEKSDNSDQKAMFKGVMDQALGVMNDSAHGLIRKDLEEKNRKIAEDFATFQKYPGDSSAKEKLTHDLDDASHSFD